MNQNEPVNQNEPELTKINQKWTQLTKMNENEPK